MELDFSTTGIEHIVTEEGHHIDTKKGYVFTIRDSNLIDIFTIIMKEIINHAKNDMHNESYIIVANKELSDEELLERVKKQDISVINLT